MADLSKTGIEDEATITAAMFTNLYDALTGDTTFGNVGSMRGVKVYRAVFCQIGTENPSVTVLENTLCTSIAWARTIEGLYTGTVTGGTITQTKTLQYYSSITNLDSDLVLVNCGRGSDSTLQFTSKDSADDFTEFHGTVHITLMVYP